jgi:hypothetical protein
MAGTAACGRSYTAGPSTRPVPAGQAACAAVTATAAPIAVAVAGPRDSAGASDPAPAIPLLLSQIAAVADTPECAGPRPAGPGGSVANGQDTVAVRQVSDRAARDALDWGTDILVTRDRSVVAYAAGRPGLVSVPLSWDRVYVLVLHPQPGRPDFVTDSLREALASDVVHADARAFGSTWVLPDTACDDDAADRAKAVVGPPSAAGRVPRAARILYDQEDSVARFLAERIAVLASTGSRLLAGVTPALGRMGTEMYVMGLPAGELPRAAMDAGAAASIIAIPAVTPRLCGEAPALPALVPLIETRAWAIVRRDAVSRIAALGGRAVVTEVPAP